MARHQKFTNRQFEEMIRTILTEELGTLDHFTNHVSFTDSIIYEGRVDDRALIFKMIDPAGVDDDVVFQEAWIYTEARKAGVPTPKVLTVDESCDRIPAPYMLVEKAPGIDMRAAGLSDEAREPYLVQMGELMRQLHSISIPGFGPLIVDQGDVRGRYDTWREAALAQFEPTLAKLKRNPHFPQERIGQAERIIAEQSQSLDTVTQGALLHGDLGQIHFFADLQAEQLTGVIDFGECKSGDPVWDFVDYSWRFVRPIMRGYPVSDEIDFYNRFYLYAILRNCVWSTRWHDVFPEDAAERMDWMIESAMTHFYPSKGD